MRTKLSGKKSFDFGGGGFIGSHLVKHLCKESCQINIISEIQKNCHFFANEPGQIKIKNYYFNQQKLII